MESESPALVQPVPKTPSSWKVRLVIGFTTFFVLLGLFVAFNYQPGAFVTALTMPSGLKSATFISTTRTTTTLYRLSGFSFTSETLPGTLISADERAPNSAQIILDAEGKYTLYLNGKSMYATTSSLAGVSVSPDGNSIAFAHSKTALVPREMPQLIPMTWFDSRMWQVTSLSLKTGVYTSIGTGSAPLFIDDTHLLRVAPGAILVTDVTTNQQSAVSPGVFYRAPVSVLQSPDRTLIGWENNPVKTISIYKTSARGVELVATMPYSGSGVYALGNDGLYIAHASPFGGGVWKQGFTDKKPHKVGFLSSAYFITRIATGSL